MERKLVSFLHPQTHLFNVCPPPCRQTRGGGRWWWCCVVWCCAEAAAAACVCPQRRHRQLQGVTSGHNSCYSKSAVAGAAAGVSAPMSAGVWGEPGPGDRMMCCTSPAASSARTPARSTQSLGITSGSTTMVLASVAAVRQPRVGATGVACLRQAPAWPGWLYYCATTTCGLHGGASRATADTHRHILRQ